MPLDQLGRVTSLRIRLAGRPWVRNRLGARRGLAWSGSDPCQLGRGLRHCRRRGQSADVDLPC